MKKTVGQFSIIAAKRVDGTIKILIDRLDCKDYRNQERFHLAMTDNNSKTEDEAIQKVADFLSGYEDVLIWEK